MKHITLIFLLQITLSISSHAADSKDCEVVFEYKHQSYCVNLQWLYAEKRQNSVFFETNTLSPVANPAQASPLYQTLYSKAFISLKKYNEIPIKSKASEPLKIQGFHAKLFMTMLNGMHHSGPSNFQETPNGYLIDRLNLTRMKGCWMIEFFIDDLKVGALDITIYSNLSDNDNYEALMFCDICSENTEKIENTDNDDSPSSHPHHH